ncbi:CoA transferase [Rhizomonospora bruguierae]|uniref:CoA transferase n=1 Tax=Rhizomonospora bruguierae TaxID=1581705 RepID=UPI001BD0CFD0|nr:CoA transferase [Micromonospora sp. NBRC 107566]
MRVVELGSHPATGYCGLLLAGLGATVSKVAVGPAYADDVALPGGAGARAAYLDQGKSMVATDQADALLAGADVVLAGLPEADLAARGWAPEALRAAHPDLVVAVATSVEPGTPGRDLQAQASSGLMYVIGEPDRPPLRLPGPQADYTAGLALLTATMFALVRRAGAGGGAVVATTGTRATAFLDWKSQIYHEDEGRVLRRGSDSGPLVLRCADGFVGFYYRPEEWPAVKRFVGDDRLDDERFATQRGRDTDRADLRAILEEFTAARDKAEIYHAGQAAGIPVGAVWDTAELLTDPQNAARDLFATADVPGAGAVRYPRLPWTIDGERTTA